MLRRKTKVASTLKSKIVQNDEFETKEDDFTEELKTDKTNETLDNKKRKQDEDVAYLENVVLGGRRENVDLIWDDGDGTSSDDEPPEEVSSKIAPRQPAWIDDDDLEPVKLPNDKKLNHLKLSTDTSNEVPGQTYKMRLKRQFKKVFTDSTPTWANLDQSKKKQRRKRRDSESETDSEEEEAERQLTQSTGSYVGKSSFLPKNILAFKRLQDVTFGNRTHKPLNTVEFHRKTPVLLVSGQTQKVVLFKIDGKKNPLIQSVAFNQFPIDSAHFSADGNRVIVGSHLHNYFYYYDLLAGNAVKVPTIKGMEQEKIEKFVLSSDGELMAIQAEFGHIHLLSAKSFEWIGTLKMNGNVSSMAFSHNDSSKLYSHGDSGQVYIWDIGQRSCLHRFVDFGCIRGTSIAIDQQNSYMACGSNTGMVNLYQLPNIFETNEPVPIKSIPNLTVTADSLSFNPTTEILAFGSSSHENAMKLFHLRSLSTFSNFPQRFGRMKQIQCIDFSPNGSYLAAGNGNGQAMLFRLHHYSQY